MFNISSPWLYPIVWMILIFTGSSFSLKEGISPFTWSDKVVHFIEYGILAILILNAFYRKTKIRSFFVLILISVVISTLYGLSDEIHQLYVPTREFDLIDLLADFSGSLVCSLFFCLYLRKRKNLL